MEDGLPPGLFHWFCWLKLAWSGNRLGLSGEVLEVVPSPLLGLFELAMEKTPESA